MKILCYCPYVSWGIHALWEATALLALQRDGAEVTYLLCDGALPVCDLDNPADPHSAEKCAKCTAGQRAFVDRLAFPHRMLGDFVSVHEIAEAVGWAKGATSDAFGQAWWDGAPVSAWIRTSLHRTHRTNVIDLAEPVMQKAFADHLGAAAIAWTAMNRAFDEIKPDMLVVLNGHRSNTRVALEVARSRGVRVLTHERGQRREAFALYADDHCLSPEVYRDIWKAWSTVPLTGPEVAETRKWLDDRMHGRNLSWHAYSPAPEGPKHVYRRLGLDPARPVWSLFTSSSDELVGLDGFERTAADQEAWVSRTLDFAREHPEVQLVVRAHPNSGEIPQDAAFLDGVARSLPCNARMVLAGDSLSSYDLAAASTVGLVFNSTMGVEMAAQGMRVLNSGYGRFARLPFMAQALGPRLDVRAAEALKLPLRYRDIRRMAYRFVRAWIFRWHVHFPLVEMGGFNAGRARYVSLDDLAPGKDAALDRIRRIVWDKAPVIPQPTAEDLERDDAAERVAFGLAEAA